MSKNTTALDDSPQAQEEKSFLSKHKLFLSACTLAMGIIVAAVVIVVALIDTGDDNDDTSQVASALDDVDAPRNLCYYASQPAIANPEVNQQGFGDEDVGLSETLLTPFLASTVGTKSVQDYYNYGDLTADATTVPLIDNGVAVSLYQDDLDQIFLVMTLHSITASTWFQGSFELSNVRSPLDPAVPGVLDDPDVPDSGFRVAEPFFYHSPTRTLSVEYMYNLADGVAVALPDEMMTGCVTVSLNERQRATTLPEPEQSHYAVNPGMSLGSYQGNTFFVDASNNQWAFNARFPAFLCARPCDDDTN